MTCTQSKKNNKIRGAIQDIIDEGGTPGFVTLYEFISMVEGRLTKYRSGRNSIGTHQMASILREYPVIREYRKGAQYNYTPVPWLRLEGSQV